MTEHSPAEWQELIKELRKVVMDPKRSRDDRYKAQSILDRISPDHRMPPPQRRPRWTDESFYTDEVI